MSEKPKSKRSVKPNANTSEKPKKPRQMACAMSLDGSESPTPKDVPHSWKNPKYKPEMCERIQEWYADGKSDAQIAHRLDICKDTFYEWVKRYPEFAKSVVRGKTASEEWWSNLGQDMAKGVVKGSEKIWLITMKNRFKLVDSIQLEDCDHLGLNRTVKELQQLVALHKKYERDY